MRAPLHPYTQGLMGAHGARRPARPALDIDPRLAARPQRPAARLRLRAALRAGLVRLRRRRARPAKPRARALGALPARFRRPLKHSPQANHAALSLAPRPVCHPHRHRGGDGVLHARPHRPGRPGQAPSSPPTRRRMSSTKSASNTAWTAHCRCSSACGCRRRARATWARRWAPGGRSPKTCSRPSPTPCACPWWRPSSACRRHAPRHAGRPAARHLAGQGAVGNRRERRLAAHYWLGMLLVVIFSVKLMLLPAMGAGSSSSQNWAWDMEHIRFMVLPAR